MKVVVQNWSFVAASRTLTLTDFSAARPVQLERLLLVINATTAKIIYNAADPTVATATVTSNNVITLSAITGSPANTDKLTIIYDALPGDPQSPVKLAPYATATTILSSELNSLGNNANSLASTAYDNSGLRYPWADITLNAAAAGAARSAGAAIAVYMTPRTDGTNYDDANEITAELVAVFPLDATTTARRRTVRRISLPPENVKFFARNLTGQALAASGSTVSLTPYWDQGY